MKPEAREKVHDDLSLQELCDLPDLQLDILLRLTQSVPADAFTLTESTGLDPVQIHESPADQIIRRLLDAPNRREA